MNLDGDFKVICYYTGWSTYRQGLGKFTPSEIDPTLCTHIVYSFAVLDGTSWSIKIADSWIDVENDYYGKVTDLKKGGRKVTIAIGGWNDSEGSKWSQMLRYPERLSSFIQSVVEFVKKHNFDGVDLDYEYPGCPWGACDPQQFSTDKSGFTALVIGLRNALPKPYVLSAAVSCNKNVIDQGNF
jgi:chitinase